MDIWGDSQDPAGWCMGGIPRIQLADIWEGFPGSSWQIHGRDSQVAAGGYMGRIPRVQLADIWAEFPGPSWRIYGRESQEPA